jgi:predicted Zn-dependent protease
MRSIIFILADALAIQAMSASGYDPEALTRYLERVPPPRERAARLFAVLPDRDTRLAALLQDLAELPARNYPPADPDEFGRMQEQVRSTVLPVVVPAQDRPRPTLKRQN